MSPEPCVTSTRSQRPANRYRYYKATTTWKRKKGRGLSDGTAVTNMALLSQTWHCSSSSDSLVVGDEDHDDAADEEDDDESAHHA